MKLEEQETTVTMSSIDAYVYIFTTVPKHIRKLRSKEGVTERRSGEGWADFVVDKNRFDPLTGFKRKSKPMTEEQRQAAGERLRKARENR